MSESQDPRRAEASEASVSGSLEQQPAEQDWPTEATPDTGSSGAAGEGETAENGTAEATDEQADDESAATATASAEEREPTPEESDSAPAATDVEPAATEIDASEDGHPARTADAAAEDTTGSGDEPADDPESPAVTDAEPDSPSDGVDTSATTGSGDGSDAGSVSADAPDSAGSPPEDESASAADETVTPVTGGTAADESATGPGAATGATTVSGSLDSGDEAADEADEEPATEASAGPADAASDTDVAASDEAPTPDSSNESDSGTESAESAEQTESVEAAWQEAAPVQETAVQETAPVQRGEPAEQQTEAAEGTEAAWQEAAPVQETGAETETAQDGEPARQVEAVQETEAEASPDPAPAGEDEPAPVPASAPEVSSGPTTPDDSGADPDTSDAPEPVAPKGDAEDRTEWPTDEQQRIVEAPAGVEQTQQIPALVDSGSPDDGAAEDPRDDSTGAGTQRLPVVERAPREDDTQQLPRIEDTQRIAPVRPEPRPPAETEQTQRIPRIPDTGSVEAPEQSARTAQPQDFFGLQSYSAPPAAPRTPSGQDAHPTTQLSRPSAPRAQPPSPQQPSTAQPWSQPPQQQPAPGPTQPHPVTPPEGAGQPSPPTTAVPGPASGDSAETLKAAAGKRRKSRIAAAVGLVAVLGLGIAFGTPALLDAMRDARIADPPAPVALRPAIEPVSESAPRPEPRALAAELRGPMSSPALGTAAGVVRDAQTGEVLWQQSADQAMVPASTGKLLAMSAVMLTFDHHKRFTTQVVRGPDPGTVVLVGGGDPTLSSLPEGKESVYEGAAKIDDLAEQVRETGGGQVNRILVDTSRYTGPTMAPGWLPGDVGDGYIAPIESVMLDGGRINPTETNSTRSHSSALDAGKALAERLGVPASNVAQGVAPSGASALGEVRSPTVHKLVELVLQHSDNVLAENLTREVAVATGEEPSFAGGTRAVRTVLERNGFDLSGSTMVDGSGLSMDNHVTSTVLADLLSRAASPDSGRVTGELRDMLTGLPVAAGTGSLADRYGDSDGRGWIRAKTGTLDGANSLAGTVLTQDGRLLVFALLSNGTAQQQARPALDAVAGVLQGCGCR